MNQQNIEHYSTKLIKAFVFPFRVIPPLLNLEPKIPNEGMSIPHSREPVSLARCLAPRETIIGNNNGATSKRGKKYMGGHHPDFGKRAPRMVSAQGDTIDLAQMGQDKAEAKLAFVLKHDLKGPGIHAIPVMRDTENGVPCFEVVNSRFRDWQIKTQAPVADSASYGVLAQGTTQVDPRRLDITLAGTGMEQSDEPLSAGVGATEQGKLANAVACQANTLGELGITFKAGEVILTGSQSELEQVAEGEKLEKRVRKQRLGVKFYRRSAV
uniref:2-hydroxypent-2,4-dienoate hydratase n=1 Tax=Acinetobacter sp. OP5 TaxID=1203253 RepID=I6UE80_9GAMM|nr:2-hydroxypent-2,4-dienoate hydratase [Acinetobacter sp. OP5]